MRNLKLIFYLLIFSASALCQSNFFTKDWKTIIDTTWGEGLPTDEKLKIFDSVWTLIDHEYACFHNLDLDWNQERDKYRPEIENGVSRGRFTSILNHLSMKLKETHTFFHDAEVNLNTIIKPGVPIIFSGWASGNSFGANLSPMPDSSLLVYIAANNHPLGLESGDIILGYEGVPWKILYKELLSREFPTSVCLWGSNDKTFIYSWLTSAGRNWHLFDTIDIKKYSGDTIHLPTNLMVNNSTSINYFEQLPVPGVSMDTAHWNMSWGIIEGTNIGYLYVYDWKDDNIRMDFYNALDSLINIINVDGLIFDFRVNTGGYFEMTKNGLSLLFNSNVPDLGLAIRDDPFNHYSMSISMTFYNFSPNTNFFNRPIAVLSSPFSISASDFLIKRLKTHPKVKVFGKTSSSAFASQKREVINEFVINYAYLSGWCEENSGEYLTHLEMPVDFEVSFTPEDVRKGDDTVVKTALEWIENNINNVRQNIANISSFVLFQNYPNPFNPMTLIEYYIPEAREVNFFIYDVLGNEVMRIKQGYKHPGNHKIEINASDFASGVYLYKIEAGDFVATKKMIVMK
jgi:hypothetical protein